jgi:hypothetical protein
MRLGDAFLMGNPGGATKHLWIVISDPTAHGGNGLIVNVTTHKRRAGGECSLLPGDHPWVTQECWISFGDARVVAPNQWARIQTGIAQGIVLPQAPASSSVVARIVGAAKTSVAFAPDFLKYLS